MADAETLADADALATTLVGAQPPTSPGRTTQSARISPPPVGVGGT
jgi:hypothetical protein